MWSRVGSWQGSTHRVGRHGSAPSSRQNRRRGTGCLALRCVPVIIVIVRGQVFDRACHEVGNHRVQRHTAARDQDAGLAGRRKVDFMPRCASSASMARPYTFFRQNSQCPPRGNACPSRFDAIGNRIGHGGHTYVMQGAAMDCAAARRIVFVAQQSCAGPRRCRSPFQAPERGPLSMRPRS